MEERPGDVMVAIGDLKSPDRKIMWVRVPPRALMQEFALQILHTYNLWAIFFGAFSFGESIILSSSFLAGQGIWTIWDVFWLSLAGTVLSDAIWYLLGQVLLGNSKLYDKYIAKHADAFAKVEKRIIKKPFLVLLFIKFLYGTRILTIVYLSIRKIGFIKFLIFDTIGTLIWLPVVMSVGWFGGKGIARAGVLYSRVEYSIAALAIILIVYKLINIWIGRKFTNQ